MKKLIYTALIVSFCMSMASAQSANDHMFPAAEAARPYINYDTRGFIINGKRTFIVSAGLEYARIPHQLWHDRLLRLKRAGFNCVEFYTFWNFHEPHEGQFDFSGDHDLNAFLKEVKGLDMYAIARVGPYYCAEWDFGGYPIWLRFKPDVLVRQPNAAFEKYVDRFFDHLLPVISSNQINHGGSVILVQLENEHPKGWGTIMPDSYFTFLQKKALDEGIEVPYFFSGLHHGSDPADNKAPLDDNKRPNPWLTTEFWSVWYNYYSSSQKDADDYGRRTWKIIAHGGNGYNYYMAHGGTNFGYTNNDEDAASYDYGAAVGQAGDLRPIYYQFKRNALFAQSFADILENSADATVAYKDFVADTAVHVTARNGEHGDIVFLDNPGKKTVTGNTVQGDEFTLAPGEIMPIVRKYALAPGVILNHAMTRILGISKQGDVTTIVTYGKAGTGGKLYFEPSDAVVPTVSAPAFSNTSRGTLVKVFFNEQIPTVYAFKHGEQTIKIIALSTALADRTWFVEHDNRNYIITGPEYVSDISGKDKDLKVGTETFWNQGRHYPIWLFNGTNEQMLAEPASRSNQNKAYTFSGSWQYRDASAAAAVEFSDSKWLQSKQALQMGADNDNTADAWYRTTANVKVSGTYSLKMKGGDRAIVFVDSKRAAAGDIHKKPLQLSLKKGKHTIAIFTAHDGREKLYDYVGSVQDTDAKGIRGNVILKKGGAAPAIIELTNWRMKGGPGDFSTTGKWQQLPAGKAFDRPVFYKNTFVLPAINTNSDAILRVVPAGMGHGSVWVNGYNLGRYPEKIPVTGLYIPECWLKAGVNTVVIYDEDGKAPGKVALRVEKVASRDMASVSFSIR